MRRLLSVDWDYFFPDLAWMDWGHNETALLIEYIWSQRCGDFHLKTKQSVLDCVVPDPQLLDGFWQRVLHAESKPELLVCESHAALAKWIAEWNLQIDHVDNYDQHHDCGYNESPHNSSSFNQQYHDCGAWARYLLDKRLIGTYGVHYPLWRKQEPERTQAELDQRLGRHGAYDTRTGPRRPIKYDRIFICRSGGWTPPWCDDRLQQFIVDLHQHCNQVHTADYTGLFGLRHRHPTMQQAILYRKELWAQREQMIQAIERRKQESVSLPDIATPPRRKQ